MSNPHSASARTLSQVSMKPNPPRPRATATGARRSSSRYSIPQSSPPRQVLFSAARRTPKGVFTAPASVPWPCSLRSPCLISASISWGQHHRLSKTRGGSLQQVDSRKGFREDAENPLAVGRASLVNDRPRVVIEGDSNLLKDGSHNKLSNTTCHRWNPKGPQQPQNVQDFILNVQLDTTAIEDEQGGSPGSPCADSLGSSSPPFLTCAALDTLRRLFIPMWRRYRFHKLIGWARVIVAKYVVPKVHRRRQHRHNHIAQVTRILQSTNTKLRCAALVLEARVVCIQRAYRRHRACVHAVVELNYRKLRSHVEEKYWDTVVAQRESEFLMQRHPVGAVANTEEEVAETGVDVQTHPGEIQRRADFGFPAANTNPAPVVQSYELDVCNFLMAGRLPESFIRFEMTSAVFALLRRSAARARFMDDFSKTRARCEGTESLLESSDITPIQASPVRNKGKSRAQLPHFLSDSVYVTIMNNTCYLTSLMRGDQMLRAHLARREQNLEPY